MLLLSVSVERIPASLLVYDLKQEGSAGCSHCLQFVKSRLGSVPQIVQSQPPGTIKCDLSISLMVLKIVVGTVRLLVCQTKATIAGNKKQPDLS